MSLSNKLESAWYELIAPEKKELLSDSKKLDKNIKKEAPLQKSITKLIDKIQSSKTWKERYILNTQLEELNKLNELYNISLKKNITESTKNEIKSLLKNTEIQININENLLEDDYELLKQKIENENERLEDTIDIIKPNTIRDTIEKYIDIKWINESFWDKEYQDFFDIATIEYINLFEEKIINRKLNKEEESWLTDNEWLYLNKNEARIFINNIYKNLSENNIDIDFTFSIRLKKEDYEQSFTIDLIDYDLMVKKNQIKKETLEKNRLKIIEQKKIDKQKEIVKELFILEEALDLIISHEWFIHKSKWDRTQYSWWYGTKAPWKNKYITKEKAKKELVIKVWKVKNYIDKHFSDLNKYQKIALISFFYNNWTWSKWKTNLIYRLKNMNKHVKWVGLIKPKSVANMISKYDISWGKKLEWLTKRRKEEAKLFLKET